MTNVFDEKKTAEAAAYLLKLRGGEMSYLKLIKLLYLADREMLGRYGYPITSDNYVSMKHGMVLSNTYNLIAEGVSPEENSQWANYISVPENYEVKLKTNKLIIKELSENEIKVLDQIFEKYGKWDRWKLANFTHTLKEWKDPKGSVIPVSTEELLDAISDDVEFKRDVLEDLEVSNELKKMLIAR